MTALSYILYPANAVSLAVSVAEDDESVPVLLRGKPLSEERPDGTLLTWAYEYGHYGPMTRGFTPNPDGACLRVIVADFILTVSRDQIKAV